METLAEKEKAEKLEREKISEKKRIGALISVIRKYQVNIKETQATMENLSSRGELAEDARSNYLVILGTNGREIRKLQEALAEIYAKGLPLPPPRNYHRHC